MNTTFNNMLTDYIERKSIQLPIKLEKHYFKLINQEDLNKIRANKDLLKLKNKLNSLDESNRNALEQLRFFDRSGYSEEGLSYQAKISHGRIKMNSQKVINYYEEKKKSLLEQIEYLEKQHIHILGSIYKSDQHGVINTYVKMTHRKNNYE